MTGDELLHTVATYAAVGSSALVGPIVIALSPGHPERADPVIRVWCNAVLGAAAVREEVQGLENLPAGTCVFVCNHQSNFDAPFVFARLPKHIRFVAKQELYRIPIFGAAVKAMGNIRVERTGGSEADHQAIEAAVRQVQTRTSILFFAEGTRSTDGKLRPFKKGAAILAIDAQVPIVPLAVAGAHEITPKGGLWVRSGRPLVLRVGKPIPTTGLTRADRDTLTRQAHDAVAALLEEGNRRVEEMLRP
ncbi:MAG TPA: lysophospholipid acyltransferase family protein [Myxococcaceae bacterium]|nr:lysophospholipid acyltransferase family protein [Myxococcaceae bacterium]